MPRKKTKGKSSVAIDIHPHGQEYSPHVLNLRIPKLPKKESAGEDLLQTQTSLEKRAESIDRRISETPNLIARRTAELSDIWKTRMDALFCRASEIGRATNRRLINTARDTGRKIVTIRPKKSAPHLLPLPQFGLLLILLLLVTVPLQALMLYNSVQKTKIRLLHEMSEARVNLASLEQAAARKDLDRAHQDLEGMIKNLDSLRGAFERIGPLKFVLPKSLRKAGGLLRLAETSANSMLHITAAGLDLREGRSSPAEFFEYALGEAKILRRIFENENTGVTPDGILHPVADGLRTVENILIALDKLSGKEYPRHILVVFQNPRELRATGGFAGSFAVLTFDKGRLINVEAPPGGTYAIQGQLPIARISPKPLHLINTRFEFQDANWWPEFPRSARKMAELYEAAGGSTVDAVLAVTAEVGEEILKLSGPIIAADYELNAENFVDMLQETIADDRAYDPRLPKKIITALLPAMLDASINAAQSAPLDFARLTAKLLAQKDIQIWTRDPDAQAAIVRLGIAGTLSQTDGDYLAVITSNVAGGKTDEVVDESITHDIALSAAYPAITAKETLTITRVHHGVKGDRFTGQQNIAYLRIYVPKNARLISVDGNTPPDSEMFENSTGSLTPDPEVRADEASIIYDAESGTAIWTETGKRVFGIWISVKPGQTAAARIVYEVPLRSEGELIPYTLTLDPQAGKNATVNVRLRLANGIKILTGNDTGNWSADTWSFSEPLRSTVRAAGMLYRL